MALLRLYFITCDCTLKKIKSVGAFSAEIQNLALLKEESRKMLRLKKEGEKSSISKMGQNLLYSSQPKNYYKFWGGFVNVS